MPVLTSTSLSATIEFLGVNPDGDDLTTSSREQAGFGFDGMAGDTHLGLTRQSCTRVKLQYPVGTTIRNTRQVSALSQEELEKIKIAMGLDQLEPGWLGANLVVSGIHDFSQLPPSSRLIAKNGTSLVVDMQNAPCIYPGKIIEARKPGKGKSFVKSALGIRGVTLWVECEGELRTGDTLELHIPPVCTWTESGDANAST